MIKAKARRLKPANLANLALAMLVYPMAASAQSSLTIYGLFDIGIEAAKSGGGTTVREISGGSFGSRLGFRGVEDLGGGLSAVFRLENGFVGDSGTLAQGGLIFGREASVGLAKEGFGAVTLGRIPPQSPWRKRMWTPSSGWVAAA